MISARCRRPALLAAGDFMWLKDIASHSLRSRLGLRASKFRLAAYPTSPSGSFSLFIPQLRGHSKPRAQK